MTGSRWRFNFWDWRPFFIATTYHSICKTFDRWSKHALQTSLSYLIGRTLRWWYLKETMLISGVTVNRLQKKFQQAGIWWTLIRTKSKLVRPFNYFFLLVRSFRYATPVIIYILYSILFPLVRHSQYFPVTHFCSVSVPFIILFKSLPIYGITNIFKFLDFV